MVVINKRFFALFFAIILIAGILFGIFVNWAKDNKVSELIISNASVEVNDSVVNNESESNNIDVPEEVAVEELVIKDCSLAKEIIHFSNEGSCYDARKGNLKIDVVYGLTRVGIDGIIFYVDGISVGSLGDVPVLDSSRSYTYGGLSKSPSSVVMELVVDGVVCESSETEIITSC